MRLIAGLHDVVDLHRHPESCRYCDGPVTKQIHARAGDVRTLCSCLNCGPVFEGHPGDVGPLLVDERPLAGRGLRVRAEITNPYSFPVSGQLALVLPPFEISLPDAATRFPGRRYLSGVAIVGARFSLMRRVVTLADPELIAIRTATLTPSG